MQFATLDATSMIDDVRSALDDWEAARALLSSALQSYLSACNNLTAMCTQPARRIPERNAVEDAFVVVDSELDSLSSEIQSLGSSHISMCTLRNRSGRLTRINSLPPEVLRSIFLLSNICCARDSASKGCYNALSQVDVYWRQVALDTPELWTHVDVSPDTPTRSLYSLSRMMLERSRKEMVHLHVYEPKKSSFGGGTPAVEVHKLREFLSPYTTRIGALNLETAVGSSYLIQSVIELWNAPGATIPRDLIARMPDAEFVLPLQNYRWRQARGQPAGARFRTLHLQNASLDWRTLNCCGLVDLRLESTSSGYFSIDTAQLARMFSASPKLVVLKLSELELTHWSTQEISPVVLNDLRILNIAKLEPNNLKLLLPLIAQPNASAQLSVSLMFYSDEGLPEEYQAFFSRCQVATLFHESPAERLQLPSLPSSLTHLVVLRSDLVEPDFAIEGTTQSAITVTFAAAVVSVEGLVSLVAEMGVQILNLDGCLLERLMDTDGQFNRVSEATRTALLEVFPDLVCNISEDDNTAHSPCRIMFDS